MERNKDKRKKDTETPTPTHSKARTIDVTKSRGFGFFSVMEATGPIDGDVDLVETQLDRSIDRRTARVLIEFVQAIKDRTILGRTDVEFFYLRRVLSCVVGGDFFEELDVIFRMKVPRHLSEIGWMGCVTV